MMASATPPKHSNPRHTVHAPADSDQSIMPTPRMAPSTMNTQGFRSYSVWGVQGRILQILQRRAAWRDSFTIGHGIQSPKARRRAPLGGGTEHGRNRLAAGAGPHARADFLCRRGDPWAV